MGASDFPPPPAGFGQGVPKQDSHGDMERTPSQGHASVAQDGAGYAMPPSRVTDAQMYEATEHGFHSPVKAVMSCLRNYARFRGRAARSEFWWFFAFWQIALTCGSAIDVAAGWNPVGSAAQSAATNGGPVATAVAAALLIPLFAVFSRRMHDVGRSGLYIFWIFTVIGTIWVLVRLCQSGGANVDNGYGVRT